MVGVAGIVAVAALLALSAPGAHAAGVRAGKEMPVRRTDAERAGLPSNAPPLHKAAVKRDLPLMQMIMMHNPGSVHEFDSGGFTAAHRLAAMEFDDVAHDSSGEGEDEGEDGGAVHANHRCVDAMQLLVNKGADLTVPTKDGRSMYVLAQDHAIRSYVLAKLREMPRDDTEL